eukprot:751625-Pelagomonas_calceolata.AAC.1
MFAVPSLYFCYTSSQHLLFFRQARSSSTVAPVIGTLKLAVHRHAQRPLSNSYVGTFQTAKSMFLSTVRIGRGVLKACWKDETEQENHSLGTWPWDAANPDTHVAHAAKHAANPDSHIAHASKHAANPDSPVAHAAKHPANPDSHVALAAENAVAQHCRGWGLPCLCVGIGEACEGPLNHFIRLWGPKKEMLSATSADAGSPLHAFNTRP